MAGGIGGILKDHRPTPEKAEGAARKERVEEIVKELTPPDAPPAEPKRKPGRPPKSTSKSPSRRMSDPPPMQQQQQPESAEAVADAIANKAMIRRLRIYARRFPQFAPHPGYNPHLHSARENQLVIDAIKEAVRAEVEFLTAPALISDTIRSAEQGAMYWAMSNPENPAAETIFQLHNVADAALRDPAIDLDIGLLECEISGYMPESPFLRLLINAGRVIARVFSENQLAKVAPKNSGPPPEEKYREF